jgi:peptide/nickel transport system substrate-binding protein
MPQADQVTALERGQLDYAVDPPVSAIHQLHVQHPGQVHLRPSPATLGFAYDVRSSPLDDVRVRRAIQLAVDRTRMIVGGATNSLSVTCQTLPPDFPSYRPYCPYTRDPRAQGTWSGPDLPAAQRLVDASGTRGAMISVWAPAVQERAAREVAEALSTLGYRPALHVIASTGAYFRKYLYVPSTHIQIGWSAWLADFPEPSGFFSPLFSCANVPPRGSGTNVSYFCDPAVERAMRRATVLQASDPSAANSAWARIDRMISDRSPWLPYATPQDAYVVSERAGNIQINPQWLLLLDQMWIR